MSESRTRPTNESQIRRAQRGVVAGYIHDLSERHGNGHEQKANARVSVEPREGG